MVPKLIFDIVYSYCWFTILLPNGEICIIFLTFKYYFDGNIIVKSCWLGIKIAFSIIICSNDLFSHSKNLDKAFEMHNC
jgi:hypothetical protein